VGDTQLRVDSEVLGVVVTSSVPLPAETLAFARALGRLDLGASSLGSDWTIEVRSPGRTTQIAAEYELGYAPRRGGLALLPKGDIEMRISAKSGFPLLRWRGAGIAVFDARASAVQVHRFAASADLGWMLNFLIATPLAALGVIQPFHASVVEIERDSVMLLGSRGAGKTSLALALCELGGRLVTEDVTYMTREGFYAAATVRSFMTLRVGTRSAFRDFLGLDAKFAAMSDRGRFELGVTHQERFPLDVLVDRASSNESHPRRVGLVVLPRIDPGYRGAPVSTPVDHRHVQAVANESMPPALTSWAAAVLPRQVRRAPKQPWSLLGVPAIELKLGLDYRSHGRALLRDLGAYVEK